MAVDMNFSIPYCPLPSKPPKPAKPSIREHYLPQPAPMPSAQSIIPEPPFTHPPPWSPLPFCGDTLNGLGNQIRVRASNVPLNEFDAELERLEVVEVVDMSSRGSTDQNGVEPLRARVAGVIQVAPSLSDSDHDPALDECELEASCPPPGLAGVSDPHPYSLVKLPSDDDDHVARRPRKRRKLWTRRSSRSVVTSAACTGDPSPAAAVVDDKPGKRNPTTKHSENPAGDSFSVSTVSLDDAVTNCSGDDIPVSSFLSSSVTESRVCYTITFCHEETGRLLSATANDLSNPGREGRLSVATGRCAPFTSEDDALLKKLKEDSEPWDEIAKCFLGRFKATLQVQYFTKLKHHTPPPTRKSKSRPRKHGCR
ncbi:hypothetical protein BDFG_07695 [Blastomyces dermatitidis ATCC 26199]|nr:hypothetical protein BDFG_07695 [Blastomyces dermatitidis ATCC 26199]